MGGSKPVSGGTGQIGLATIIALATALLTPPRAGAGLYRVAICNPQLGARHADVTFERTSVHYVSEAGCGTNQPGLGIRHVGKRTGDGRWGAWTMHAPGGTVISRLGVSAAGHGGGGYLPQLLAVPPIGAAQAFASPDPGMERSRFTSPARILTARLSCHRVNGCGRGRKARIRIKRIALELADHTRPTIAVGGAALQPGSKRGVQPLTVDAQDVGGGVHRFLLDVNGQPVTASTPRCRIEDGWALRMRPCPQRAHTTWRLQTAAGPFHQGVNVLRACSSDYAIGTLANRACTTRRIRVDNLCPISHTGPGSQLQAQLIRERPPDERRPSIAIRGRLLAASGTAVAGARVCVATRVPIAGALERVVATPTTDADGRFATELAQGPSRQVRVAYWWTHADVAERHLRLRVRAHPRLILRPKGVLHNGQRVWFTVELQGPAAEGRWVRIQARADHRWVEVRNGRANADGVYRTRYRFHATTGRRRYRFRAVVPSQRGYPYLRGQSRVRRITVIGQR
jgi:hypothetical protein